MRGAEDRKGEGCGLGDGGDDLVEEFLGREINQERRGEQSRGEERRGEQRGGFRNRMGSPGRGALVLITV